MKNMYCSCYTVQTSDDAVATYEEVVENQEEATEEQEGVSALDGRHTAAWPSKKRPGVHRSRQLEEEEADAR